MKTSVLTLLALVAFAGNSVLCRLALADSSIDPVSFTSIRLVSGVVVLIPLVVLNGAPSKMHENGSWLAGFMLFAYAALFSFAYVSIDTATGALVLFGSVQISMILISVIRGQRLNVFDWSGVVIAMLGFMYLVGPDLRTPSIKGFLMMAFAGIAWAVYTVLGQGASHALRATAYNFLRTSPMVLLLLLGAFGDKLLHTLAANSHQGVGLAVLSGAVTSGLGYAIWYAVLPKLKTTHAAVIQLLVPVIAALGGVVFAEEIISSRLVLSSLLVLGGILLITLNKSK